MRLRIQHSNCTCTFESLYFGDLLVQYAKMHLILFIDVILANVTTDLLAETNNNHKTYSRKPWVIVISSTNFATLSSTFWIKVINSNVLVIWNYLSIPQFHVHGHCLALKVSDLSTDATEISLEIGQQVLKLSQHSIHII